MTQHQLRPSTSARVRQPLTASKDFDPREVPLPTDLATRHVLPMVGQRRKTSDALMAGAGIALVVLLGLGTFWSMNHEHHAPAVPSSSAVHTAMASPLPVLPQAALTPLTPTPTPTPLASPFAIAPANSVNSLASPGVLFDSGTLPAPGSASAHGVLPASGTEDTQLVTGKNNDDFATRLGVAGSGKATAAIAINTATTVAQGTLIPAVLETGIDTDVPGYVRAIVSADVRSFDGTRVLVPRSSRLVGQYKSGLSQGQRRVYVIWTRLIRPDGVAVSLGSPATDFGGESGVPGQVNSHFFARFGSAMLMTVLSGLTAIGSSGTAIMIGGAGQSAAATAVSQTGEISPTVRVHPGQPIRVFTARDLDFSQVASL